MGFILRIHACFVNPTNPKFGIHSSHVYKHVMNESQGGSPNIPTRKELRVCELSNRIAHAREDRSKVDEAFSARIAHAREGGMPKIVFYVIA